MYHIVDIDHTLANSFWRDFMIGVVSWNEYHEASELDVPFPKMVELINALKKNGDLIIAVTGRTDNFRGLTLDWLIKHNIMVNDLLMRPEGVYLKNPEMKVQLISKYFNNVFDLIGYAIDDNEETILAYHKLGIATLQVRNIP
jgi:hypothetical protein